MTTESKLRAALEKIANSTFSDLNSQNTAREALALPQSAEESGWKLRGWIADLIREEFDPRPSNEAYPAQWDGWDDGAEEIASKIIQQLLPAPPASTAKEEVE